ncbi:hypothetical protein ACFE04_024025 [Oxalis oulophora]
MSASSRPRFGYLFAGPGKARQAHNLFSNLVLDNPVQQSSLTSHDQQVPVPTNLPRSNSSHSDHEHPAQPRPTTELLVLLFLLRLLRRLDRVGRTRRVQIKSRVPSSIGDVVIDAPATAIDNDSCPSLCLEAVPLPLPRSRAPPFAQKSCPSLCPEAVPLPLPRSRLEPLPSLRRRR